jgi:hypothetical protein
MRKFKLPEPIPYEPNDRYLLRCLEAFEEWVNEREGVRE